MKIVQKIRGETQVGETLEYSYWLETIDGGGIKVMCHVNTPTNSATNCLAIFLTGGGGTQVQLIHPGGVNDRYFKTHTHRGEMGIDL